jgi:hypothetical protein
MAKQPEHALSQWTIAALFRRWDGSAHCIWVPAEDNGAPFPVSLAPDVRRKGRDHDSPAPRRSRRRNEWDE